MTVSELLELIDTDMNKAIVDGNNDSKLKTGDKLRLSSDNGTLEYTISVKGDVLGTGILNKGNASEITKHIVNKKLITGNIYLNAADYNNDDKIKMDDVMQMIIDMKKS